MDFRAAPSAARISTLQLERWRSPPAAHRSVELVWSIPEAYHSLCCCGPGRREVRSWRVRGAPRIAV